MFSLPIATTTLTLPIAVAGCALLWGIFQRFRSRKNLPLPPGPSRLPLVENLFDIPTGKRWEIFADWGEKWGDIVSVSAFGTNFIMLNSFEAANELLDKRSRIYADRPDIPMAGTLVGWRNIVSFLHYSDHFKQCRRLMHGLVGTFVSLKKLHHIHEQEIHKFLKSLLHVRRPEELEHIIMHTSGAILLRVVYGYTEDKVKARFVQTADQAVNDLYIAVSGEFLVDIFPSLGHIPAWFPGAGFRRRAMKWSKTFNDMVERPFTWAKRQLVEGSNEPSFVGDLVREGVEDEFTIKWAGASMSAAGPDTTAWTIYAFFKAMAIYPEVMARAQAELDAVIGNSRLPQLSDRPNLPYIDAMVLESIRWHPVAPLGFPHRLTEDDTYGGYFFPKGSLVQANVWKITQDASIYPNPTVFDPTRFIASKINKPQPTPDYTFGWGRRLCPGKLMAHEVIFITIAQTLATFNIEKPIVDGVVIHPTVERSEGVVSRPSAFQCTISPRGDKALMLINEPVAEQ